ncbi:MAG: efflux RND transporter periplasmic adaptor subunit [Rhodopila sp.]|nr:efflux RND transporter periplasmic adaptor subunit [Rhodopila sp.]
MAALVVSLGACNDEKKAPEGAAAPPKPEVSVVTVKPQRMSMTTELPGRTSPFRVAEVRPQVNGVIKRRLFTEGAEVTANEQLYQIDPAPYEAALASAKAGLAKAQALLASGQATVNRYRTLAQANAVSHQDLDTAVAALRQTEADIASGQANVKTAEINLAYTRVLSPISGRASRSSITEGGLVTADQAASLVTVTQLNPIYVDVTQPSGTLLRLKRELASGRIEAAGDNQAVVKLVLEDGTEYAQPGRLQFSEVTVDQTTGSVTLRAIFPNDDGLLLPGMFVRERLDEGVRDAAILVPQRGVTHNVRGEPTAMVVGADNKVAVRVLTADRTVGDNWLVTSGLVAGDKVIVEGLQKVRPGVEVVTREFDVPNANKTTASR